MISSLRLFAIRLLEYLNIERAYNCILYRQTLKNSHTFNNADSSYKLTFEQSAILFNIASMYSQLALTENRASEDGLKKAALFYQQAAGTLGHLLQELQDWGVTEKGRSQLESLQSLCLGQAQNLFVDKAIQGVSFFYLFLGMLFLCHAYSLQFAIASFSAIHST